jgi:hypothetical protein
VNDLRAIGVWLVREGAELLRWLREPGLWATLLAGLLLWSLAYQTTPTPVLHVGGDRTTHKRDYDAPFLIAGGFNASEPDKDNWWLDQPYRWARDDATVLLPGLGGGRWAISVLAASGRPDGSAIESLWQIGDDALLSIRIDAAPRVYHILGNASGGDLRLTMRTPRYAAPSDSRNLGFVVHRIAVSSANAAGPHLPAPGQLALLALLLFVGYSLARRLALPQRWALPLALGVAAAFALVLAEHRLALTTWTPALMLLSVICYLLAVLLASLLVAAASAAGLHSARGELGAALGATIGAFGLRMAGLLHPYAKFSDLGFNVHNLEEVIRGDLFLYAGLPAEVGGGQAPYPPAQYLALAPLRLLFGGDQQSGWLIQGGNALLESGSAVLIWLLLRRAGLGRRAALLGAALYIVIPPLLRSFSVGEFANIFGQSLLLPLLLFLVLGAPHADRWLVVLVGSLLLLLILLSHTGVTISTLALLLAWLPLWWLGGHRARMWQLLAAGVAAGLIALVLFYSGYIGLIEQRRAAAPVSVTTGAEEPSAPDRPFGEKVLGELRSGFSAAKGISPLLAITGGLGLLWLWRRQPAQLDLALLAGWLGMLLSFATLLRSDQAVRWQAFLFPVLCLGAAPLLAAWSWRGRAGALLALLALGYLTWLGVDLWAGQILTYLH